MSIYSNDNISKIAKLTTRELPHLAKTAKITVRENNGVYSNANNIFIKSDSRIFKINVFQSEWLYDRIWYKNWIYILS